MQALSLALVAILASASNATASTLTEAPASAEQLDLNQLNAERAKAAQRVAEIDAARTKYAQNILNGQILRMQDADSKVVRSDEVMQRLGAPILTDQHYIAFTLEEGATLDANAARQAISDKLVQADAALVNICRDKIPADWPIATFAFDLDHSGQIVWGPVLVELVSGEDSPKSRDEAMGAQTCLQKNLKPMKFVELSTDVKKVQVIWRNRVGG